VFLLGADKLIPPHKHLVNLVPLVK
jgi:hypothetical protein